MDLKAPALLVEGSALSFAQSKLLVFMPQPNVKDLSRKARHSVLPGEGIASWMHVTYSVYKVML